MSVSLDKPDVVLDPFESAYVDGVMTAAHHIYTFGETLDAPLSGEWAGDPTPQSILRRFDADEVSTVDWSVVDSWEDGYNSIHDYTIPRDLSLWTLGRFYDGLAGDVTARLVAARTL